MKNRIQTGRYLVSLFVLAFTVIPVSSQDEAIWENLTNSNEEFLVSMPSNGFVDASVRIKKKNSSKRNYYGRYKSVLDSTTFFVRSDGKDWKSDFSFILDFARRNSANERNVEIDRFEGLSLSFTESTGYFHRIVAIPTKNRFYVFHTVSLSENLPATSKFLNSIKLDRNVIETDNIRFGDFRKIVKTLRPDVGVVTERSNANRDTQYSLARERREQNGMRFPIKILASPKPGYTEIARIYYIQGAVMLRVTFQQNGKIGQIDATEKLPFGLTQRAIAAASKIKFLPGVRDGKPYSAIKRVQYNFSIY